MKDQPLSCKLEGDELVIRIGIDTLAFATDLRSPVVEENPIHIEFDEEEQELVALSMNDMESHG